MRGKHSIVINGRRYDVTSGAPLDTPQTLRSSGRRSVSDIIPSRPQPGEQRDTTSVAPPKRDTSAKDLHRQTQRSQTLLRAPLEKPAAKHAGEVKRSRAIVPKSPHIVRFQTTKSAPKKHAKHQLEQASSHPVAAKATAKHRQRTHVPAKVSSKAVKEHLINEQLAKADTTRQFIDVTPENSPSGLARFTTLATGALAIVALVGYLTYLSVPGVSLRVAAVQAGIEASIPDYRPDGFRFDGPITFGEGTVAINYRANGGPQTYSVSQKNSDWDSQAILDNYVLEKSGGDYSIHSAKGLTVYTFKNKAVWVNRGILHEVDYTNAPLSFNHIERIAVSM